MVRSRSDPDRAAPCAVGTRNRRIRHGGFEAFRTGQFDDGGSNLYVTARGDIERIHRTDLDGDGFVDVVIANSHGYLERGPTRIFSPTAGGARGPGAPWQHRDLPNDSGWLCRAIDLDGDGHLDLIVVNGENGVTSELMSYVYWGGPGGLTGERTEIPTAGAYDVACLDIDGDGRLDLVFPSAWTDHHNPGLPRPMHVWLQREPRHFSDETERIGLVAEGAVAVASGDLRGTGLVDLVIASYCRAYDLDAESIIYWGLPGGGFDPIPQRLPTHGAGLVRLGDLDGDGGPEIVFAGGDEVRIYWNCSGRFDPGDRTVVAAHGIQGQFRRGALGLELADVDGDGRVELLIGTIDGVEIRPGSSPERLLATLDDDRPETRARSSHIFWGGPEGFAAERSTILPTYGTGDGYLADLDGDGWLDLVVAEKTGELVIHHGGPDGLPSGRQTRIPLGVRGHPSSITAADLDGDGWLDLVVGIAGHYTRSPETFMVLWGGPDGYDTARSVRHDGSYTPGQVTVADLGDGALSILVPAYSSATSRRLPWEIFRVEGREIDLAAPRRFPGLGSCHVMPIDVDGDGWVDLLVSNHRDDIRHDADAVLYWNGPDGLSEARSTRFPALGPHNLTVRDPGNAMDRGPGEAYVSPPLGIGDARLRVLDWDADVPEGTELVFELRWADDEDELARRAWQGPDGPGSRWVSPGRIPAAASALYLQYRATFISRTGARSPRLRSVTVTAGEGAEA